MRSVLFTLSSMSLGLFTTLAMADVPHVDDFTVTLHPDPWTMGSDLCYKTSATAEQVCDVVNMGEIKLMDGGSPSSEASYIDRLSTPDLQNFVKGYKHFFVRYLAINKPNEKPTYIVQISFSALFSSQAINAWGTVDKDSSGKTVLTPAGYGENTDDGKQIINQDNFRQMSNDQKLIQVGDEISTLFLNPPPVPAPTNPQN